MVGFVVFHTLSSTAQLLAPHPDLRCRTSPSIWTLRRKQPVQSFFRLDYIFSQLHFRAPFIYRSQSARHPFACQREIINGNQKWGWGWRVIAASLRLKSALPRSEE